MELIKLGNMEISEKSLSNLIKLADSLDSVETKNNGDLYVKFKRNVIFETPNNFAVLTDGFNVQYASQIHFNPEFEKDKFKDMIKNDFEQSRYAIIERAAELMEKELTHEEIEAVVNGKKLISIENYEHQCNDHKHAEKHHECDGECIHKEI